MHHADPLPQLIHLVDPVVLEQNEYGLFFTCYIKWGLTPREVEPILLRLLEITRAMSAFRGPHAEAWDHAYEANRPNLKRDLAPREPEPPTPARQPDVR
jgi:hypothetical protein